MKKYKKKYNKGTQKVDVPPTMTGADVGAQALSGAASGAAIGSGIGPWGTVIGGAVGGIVGGAKGLTEKDKAQQANTKALSINAQADKNFNTAVDPNLQNYQYKKGGSIAKTKEIEIEGKRFPEIHTDKNYNIKTLGDTPHSEGGTKTIAEEGDVVFDTQNSESDYKKVMYDINLYKMKGDKNALKRLEKRRQEMPSDENKEKAYGDSGELSSDFLENKNIPSVNAQYPILQGNEIGTDMFGNPIIDKGNNYDGLGGPSQYVDNTQPFTSLAGTGTLGIPDGGGRSTIEDKPITREPKQIGNIGRYANIAYNAVQSFNKPTPTLQRELQLNRYKYSDMSDPLREAARQNRATQLYNAGRAGTSIGQQLSYAQQGQNNYISQLGQINAGENERKQNIQNANVDLSNQENQTNYQRAFMNNDISARRRATQQQYGAAATSEVASLAEIQKQEQLQRLREQNVMKRDQQYLDILRTKNHSYDKDLNEQFTSTYSKGTSKIIKPKSRYVYKSSTKTKK